MAKKKSKKWRRPFLLNTLKLWCDTISDEQKTILGAFKSLIVFSINGSKLILSLVKEKIQITLRGSFMLYLLDVSLIPIWILFIGTLA